MTPISPAIEAKRWIIGVLTPDPVLSPLLGDRYYEVPAPANAADPFFVMQAYQSPQDVYTNGAALIYTNIYLRTTVAQRGATVSSPANLEAIDNRITLLLHRGSGSTGTASVIACTRVGPALALPDFDKRTGAQYATVGSNWHLIVQ